MVKGVGFGKTGLCRAAILNCRAVVFKGGIPIPSTFFDLSEIVLKEGQIQYIVKPLEDAQRALVVRSCGNQVASMETDSAFFDFNQG